MKIEIPSNIRLSTLLKAIGIVLVAVALYRGYYWRQNVNDRGWHSDLTYDFLAGAIKAPDGKIYNRSQVLDALVQNALKQAVQAQQQKAPPQIQQIPGPEPKKK